MVAYYVGVVALVVVTGAAVAGAADALAVPRAVTALRAFGQPKPTEAPPDNPVWPLWWAPLAFLHTRRAGGLLILGLLGWAIWSPSAGLTERSLTRSRPSPVDPCVGGMRRACRIIGALWTAAMGYGRSDRRHRSLPRSALTSQPRAPLPSTCSRRAGHPTDIDARFGGRGSVVPDWHVLVPHSLSTCGGGITHESAGRNATPRDTGTTTSTSASRASWSRSAWSAPPTSGTPTAGAAAAARSPGSTRTGRPPRPRSRKSTSARRTTSRRCGRAWPSRAGRPRTSASSPTGWPSWSATGRSVPSSSGAATTSHPHCHARRAHR